MSAGLTPYMDNSVCKAVRMTVINAGLDVDSEMRDDGVCCGGALVRTLRLLLVAGVGAPRSGFGEDGFDGVKNRRELNGLLGVLSR